MMKFAPLFLRSCLLTIATLALLTVPFAHRAGAEPVTSQMAQYLAMGGDIADICGEAGGHLNSGCKSCLISATMLLPSPVHTGQRVDYSRDFSTLSASQHMSALPVQFSHPPVRGPPRS